MAVFDDVATMGVASSSSTAIASSGRDGEPEAVQRPPRHRSRSTEREPLREECRHFLDCVAHAARAPHRRGARALRVLRVLERGPASPCHG